jgi:hypothetical protein
MTKWVPYICRIFYSEAAQNIFFSGAHGTLFKIDHILGHKECLIKYKKVEVIPCIMLDHDGK